MEKYRRAGPVTYMLHGACAVHPGYLRLQTHTQNICNPYFLSTATMVGRKRIYIYIDIVLDGNEV